ncbi:MAG: hypothetical protein PHI06_10815 [Desulfobulbaceae bacterium]|nr:hypothetical protein [Desulfobulbaceae bacterium]
MTTLGVVLALGLLSAHSQARGVDVEMRANLLRQAVEISWSINPMLVKKPTFTEEDKGTVAFERIREQMIAAG